MPKPLEKALAVSLALCILITSPGAASYAVAAEVVGTAAQGTQTQTGPTALPAVNAPISAALPSSLATPASLKGVLSAVPQQAPSVIAPQGPGAASVLAPAEAAQPVPAAPPAPAAPSAALSAPASPAGPAPELVRPASKAASAWEHLQSAVKGAAQVLKGKGPEASLKAGADAAFDNGPAPAAAVPTAEPDPKRYISEDVLGWRKVQGVKADPGLKPLSAHADAAQVMDQISRQFGFSKDELVSLAAQYRLRPESSAQDWLSVYDRLQKINREQFKILDRKKYEGWGSFRSLANKDYAPGWQGGLMRALEVQKHLLGFLVRFPYHLFDSFIFGYFRQNIAFEFFHSTENFLDLKAPDDKADKEKEKNRLAGVANPDDDKRQTLKWLEESLRHYAFKGPGLLSGLKAQPWVRTIDRFLFSPFLEPLTNFIVRRLALAVASAVAMGMLGAFAPALPLSFALTSLPVLGPAIVAFAQGAPALIGWVPFIGPLLAPVVTAAMSAVVKDLVLGPLLNTLILSTLLTLPASLKEQTFALRKIDPTNPLSVLDYLRAFGNTLIAASFWKQNLKSFLGMVTIGGEIEGIMAYAGAVDGLFNPAFQGLTGRQFTLFHSIGAAVEKPKGESPIPFGGAITWGNVLFYKLQEVTGVQISDWTMRAVLGLKSAVHDTARDAAVAGLSAQASVAAASQRQGSPDFKFDPELYQKGPEAVLARIKELAGQAGNLQAEMAAVKGHMAALETSLLAAERRADELQGQSRPISAEEQAEYDRLVSELGSKRGENYVRSKLSELHDLKNPQPEDLARLRELKKLQEYYDALLLPPAPGPDPMKAELGVRDAALKALSEHLTALADGRQVRSGSSVQLDGATLESVRKLVQEVEELRSQSLAELANRDAAQTLLAVTNKTRNQALRERRDGKEMLEFHKNLSRLATVMDLALSLNEIAAAQAAIKQMLDMLDSKLSKINAAGGANQQGTNLSEEMKAQVAKWRADIDVALAEDDSTKARIVTNEGKATLAAGRFQSFHDDMSALLARIDGEDGGASGDALKEYQRRLDLLPQARAWRTDGNPSNPDAFSLKGFQADLAEVEDYLRKAEDGVSQLQTMPLEFAGVAIVAVPGPQVTVNNPTRDQVLRILSERKVYWQEKRAQYQKNLDTVNRYMDPGNSRTSVDEFGEAAPESLPRWRSQQADVLSRSQAEAAQYLAQIDALAAQINGVTGSDIPMLSGRSVEDLRGAIPGYGDKLRAVRFPTGTDPNIFVAQMNLVSIAKLLPHAARDVIHWAKADVTIKAIDKAMSGTLPTAQTKLRNVVAMLDAVLVDVDADQGYMASGGDPQALINRKIALLQVKVLPALRDAKSLLQDTMIPYQQESIDSAKDGGDLATLFDAQKTLMTTAKDLYQNTLPWAFATYGAAQGDKAAGHASVADFRKMLQDNLNGFDDAKGHSKGVKEYQLEVANRKDPNYAGTEVLYGETMPYSLPRKIDQYTAERSQRAGEINSQASQINEILGKIESLSKGKYNLQAFRMPTDVTGDKAGVARVQALVDNGSLRGLGDKLSAIGNEASAASGSIDLGVGGGQTVPSGDQAPITVSDNQQIALLALEAAKRLVPSTAQNQASAPAYYAVARFLFSDGIIDASQDGLQNQVPQAEAFLGRAAQALSDAIDDTAKDDAYVDSGGASETVEATYGRKIATFTKLSAVLREGKSFFDVKKGWDQASFATLDKVASYYNSLGDVYSGGTRVNESEVEAQRKMRAALQKTYDDLEANRRKVTTWMGQLNDPHESALRRVSESISELQEKTRAVLESNVEYHQLQDQVSRSQTILQALLTQAEDKQGELQGVLAKPEVRDGLPADLVDRIEALRLGRGAWAVADGKSRDTQALVVRKAEFGAFLDAVLGMFQAQSPGMNLSAIRADMLKNPASLASLIPNSAVMDFGDTADGFYLVYQTRFAVPKGLETSNWVTLGNVAQVWGNNVSVTGYQFASPPSDVNAPYGDKGVEVQIESLQGANWVNYLNVDLHRFALDVPADMNVHSQAEQSRMLIFDDFAMMLFGDRLYVGMAGFADFATQDASQKPSYYGGNFKSSLKLTEVMKLNFEQQELFAKDPRKFMQEVNLDFTGYDPDLNRDLVISASGENKHYSRTEVGPSFDLGRLLQSPDAFTVDLFFANTSGTDDFAQKSVGATVLKGFTIRDSQGKPQAQITNKLTGELGQQYNSVTDRLSVTLPDYGIVVSGEGKLLGTAKAYYGEVAKKLGERSTVSVGYGSPYVGMNNRLSVSANTSFTLADLWQAVVDKSGQDLKGGETLKAFNTDMDEFFKTAGDAGAAPSAAPLKQVFAQDIARQLISQDIGRLTRDIQDLRKAGAFLDNTRMRGMVGFVTNPVSTDLTDRAAGGGFVAGTYTEMTMTRSQKALVAAKAESLYREGLRLQGRLVDLVKQWQAAVTDMAQAQWELKMAEFAVQNSPSAAARAEAEVIRARATADLHQALVRYNLLSGRDPNAAPPFQNIDAATLEGLQAEIRRTIASPDRLSEILRSLDRSELEAKLGAEPFNLVDWLPWVDRLSAGVGVQLQDMMANQILTAGVSVRLPIHDPGSRARDNAYVLEQQATVAEMSQTWHDWRLQAAKETESARAWAASADALRPGLPKATEDLGMAIRAYRNGIIPASQLREAYASWRWYTSSVLEADGKAALAGAWSSLDQGFTGAAAAPASPLRVARLDDAFAEVSRNSHSLEEVARRQEAAAAMTEANDHRIQKAMLDIQLGTGLTATGVGWIPSLAVTGIPVMGVLSFELKPEELRELQVKQGQGQTEYYRQLKAKLEADLAVRFTQNLLAYQTAGQVAGVLRGQVIPGLERELAAAAAGELPGGPDVPVTSATRRLDEAKARLVQVELSQQSARATMNYLLGRPEASPLEVGLSGEAALAELGRVLAGNDPVAAQRGVLAARVEVARAVETMVDKDLKVEQLSLEPVSLVVRSLGRLIDALGSDSIGNPDLVAAARVQTLTEERAQAAFDLDLQSRAARAQTDLRAAQGRLESLQGRPDAASALERAVLEGRARALRASLAALGRPDGAASASSYAGLPASSAELRSRLSEAQRALSARPPESPVEVMAPEVLRHGSAAFARYYHARSTLDQSVKVDKDFAEGWIEVRLRSPETPPETLVALAKLRQEKADRIYRNNLAGASAQASVLEAQFETNVRLWRWAQAQLRESGPDAGAVSGQDLRQFMGELRQKLLDQRGQMAALLGLDPGQDPGASLDALMRLVPEDPAGSRDLGALGGEFVAQVRALQLDQVRRTLFDGGLPASAGSEDNLISQLRADTIAERMSYKGFTPVAAFGAFRGQHVGGAFLEAPDPQSIERGLSDVLSDVLRKELVSSGRMKELTLRLNELMLRVADGSRTIEARRKLIQAAESEYRSKLALADGPAGLAEARSAQERLVTAWLEFGQSLTETKSAFISLVSELEALGQGRSTWLRPAAAPLSDDLRGPRKDPRAELLSYGSRRMLDPRFAAGLDQVLSGLAPGVTAELRQRLSARADLYRAAVQDGEAVMLREFTPAERIHLLTLNDKEGKRQAVQAELSEVLAAVGRLDPRSNPAWARLLNFLRDDIAAQAPRAEQDRVDEVAVSAAMRDAYWHAAPAPFAVEGAFRRIEALQTSLVAAKQALLESYLTDLSSDPQKFVLRDLKLDDYLKAEQAFDAELVKTFESQEVRDNGNLARGLDGLYDLRASVRRLQEGVRYGRGMQALDALLMLEESRLAAERWRGAAPEEIDATAAALQGLRDTKGRWLARAIDLDPLYAVVKVGADGRSLWSVDRWLTAEEVAAMSPQQVQAFKAQGLELVGGVDATEAVQDGAAQAAGQNREDIDLHANMQRGDFVLAAGPGQSRVLSFAEVFGPQGLVERGRVFFFDAPRAADRPGALHAAVHPLTALARAPELNAVYVYTGAEESLPRGLFPTMESLRASEQAKDFQRLVVTAQGAGALMSWSGGRRDAELSRGWLEVKLNGFGFARDGAGKVSELYLTEDDFNAAHKSLRNADKDLRAAEADLAETQRRLGPLQDEAAAKKAAAEQAGAEFQRRQAEIRAALRPTVETANPQREGESAQSWDARVKIALDQALAANRDFREVRKLLDPRLDPDLAKQYAKEYVQAAEQLKEAQKAFEPVAKAYSEASDRLREGQAVAANKATALEQAKTILADSRSWSLYRSADLVLGLDGRRRVAAASAAPVFGGSRLDERFGEAATGPAIAGELLAALVDADGGVRAITDPEEFSRAAAGWTIKSVAMGGTSAAASPDGRSVSPTYRLSHYEATVSEDGKTLSLPVSLNRRYLQQSLEGAESKAWRAKHWAVMPYNWGSILLEVPRGIVGAPVELLTGRDPRQHHYLGRATMYKTEGGETERYGFLRQVANTVDILNLLPDPVGRYYDPSQFPDRVQVDSPIQPGQNLIEKDMRALQGDKNIHFGVKSAQRTVDHALEDILAARERTLSRFQGGVEQLLVETRSGRGVVQDGPLKGRARTYEESTRRGLHLPEGVSAAMSAAAVEGRTSQESELRRALRDPLVLQDPASGGTGDGEVVLTALPGNLAVDRVEQRVRVIAGAAQYSAQEEALKGYPQRVAEQGAQAQAKAPQLAADLEAARRALTAAEQLRDKVRTEEEAVWQRAHELSWRIAAQKLLEAEISRLRGEAAGLRQALAWWQGYLGRLDDAVHHLPVDPSHPPVSAPLALWAVVLSVLAALAAALVGWWLRRRGATAALGA